MLTEVEYWYRKLTRANRTASDKNITAIEERIRANPDAPEVDELYRCLSDQYSAHGDFAAAEAINLELAKRHPDDPLPLNSVATNKLSFLNQPEEAMDVINRALEVAHRTGELRRYTLGNKARIALDLKRYDIVEGVLRVVANAPQAREGHAASIVYNIGHNEAVALTDFIDTLSRILGRPAIRDDQPMQPGDMAATYASIDRLRAATGFTPQTSLEDGLARFVTWYRDYYGV